MIQVDLFDGEGMARRTDPETSHDAAKSINTTRLEAEVLAAIRTFGDKGCIADEIEARLPHLQWCTLTPRFKPLLEKGLIEDTGDKRTGMSKRAQRVVRAVAPENVEKVKLAYARSAYNRNLERIVDQVKQLGPSATRLVVSRLNSMSLT